MENALIPFSEIKEMGLTISKSGLFGIKTADQAIALMLIAQAEGRHPATVAMDYDIILGKPAIRSQVALKRFQESGGTIQYLERTEKKVSAKFTHPKGGEIIVSWDMERARKMGLDKKDNWIKQPMIMLQWRVVAEGVRACYPACLSGSYLDTEVQDFDAPKSQAVKTDCVVVPEERKEDQLKKVDHLPDRVPADTGKTILKHTEIDTRTLKAITVFFTTTAKKTALLSKDYDECRLSYLSKILGLEYPLLSSKMLDSAQITKAYEVAIKQPNSIENYIKEWLENQEPVKTTLDQDSKEFLNSLPVPETPKESEDFL